MPTVQPPAGVAYPLALEDRKLTKIAEAARGQTYRCPGCRGPMAPVKGPAKSWHFRHHHGAGACSKESVLHATAQLLIQREFRLAVRERRNYAVSAPCLSCRNPADPVNIALRGARLTLENTGMIRGTRQDITVERGKLKVIIEVVVTHALEERTRRLYAESGIPAYILRLRGFEDLAKLEGGVAADSSINAARHCRSCLQERENRDAKLREDRKEAARRRTAQRNRERPVRRAMTGALKRMTRRKSNRLLFTPWYLEREGPWGRAREIPAREQRAVFADAIGLTEMGFEQRDPDTPWLFSTSAGKGITVCADLSGADSEDRMGRRAGARISVQGVPPEMEEAGAELAESVRERLRQEDIGVREDEPDESHLRAEPRMFRGAPASLRRFTD